MSTTMTVKTSKTALLDAVENLLYEIIFHTVPDKIRFRVIEILDIDYENDFDALLTAAERLLNESASQDLSPLVQDDMSVLLAEYEHFTGKDLSA